MKINLGCESSTLQTIHMTIHMKCKILFSVKNTHKKIKMLFATVVISTLRDLKFGEKLQSMRFFLLGLM